MKSFNVRAVTEGAIVTALTVTLLVMGIYVPVFRLFTVFVSGIPLVYLIIKRGLHISVISLAASLLLMFALTGDIISGIFTGAVSLLPALVIGYCMKNDCRYYTTLLAGIIAVLFGYLIDIMQINAMAGGQNVIMSMLDESVEMIKQAVSSYLTVIGDSGELMELVSDGLNQTKSSVLLYFPTILIFGSSVTGYIIVSVCIFFMNRLRVKKYEYVRFYMIKIPKSMCIITFILMIISFLSYDSTIPTLALKNMTAILSIALAVDGMSTIDFSFRKKVRSGYLRFGIYLLVFILGYFLISIIFYILMFLGVLDAYLDVRMLQRAGDDR